jgi:hypothetical protein
MIVFGSSRVYVVVLWVATNLFRYKLTRDSFHGFPWLLLSLFVLTHTALHFGQGQCRMDADLGLVRHPSVLARCRTITLCIGWSFYLSLQRDVSFARYVAQYRCTFFVGLPVPCHAPERLQRTGIIFR